LQTAKDGEDDFAVLSLLVRKVNHHQKPMEGKTMRIGVPQEG
jgi:NAD(P) transhydrogenase subunit alpha